MHIPRNALLLAENPQTLLAFPRPAPRYCCLLREGIISPQMQKDDQTAATKKDLKELREEMKKDFKELKEKDLREMEDRLMQHFNVVAENLVRDFQGIFKDRLEQHEDRIVCLEQHAGLAAR